MYKTPRFVAIGPVSGKPVMLDDTCYFIACHSAEQAAFLAALLNDRLCQDFLLSVTFSDAKRPITKKLLQRIDLAALLERADRSNLLAKANTEFAKLTGHQNGAHWPSQLEVFLTPETEHDANIQLSLFV
jgi:hypothetical protein